MSGVGIIYLWANKEFPSFIRLEGKRGDYEVYTPERTCYIEFPYFGDAPVINGQPRCSECKASFEVGMFPNYCPSCGARVIKSDQDLAQVVGE